MAERRIDIPYKPRRQQLEIHEAIESHRYSVVVSHRRFGKTVCMINHLIKQALLDISGSGRYGYVAPYRNQAKSIAWDYLKHFSAPVPGRVINEGDLLIEFPHGSRIRLFGADNADAMRGLYFNGVILDEVADMKPEVWGEIVSPALIDHRGWACFIGTPKGMNLFYELYTTGQNTPDWCAKLYRADETGIIPPEELESARIIMSANQFRQEFLCDFSASVDNILITIDMVAKAAAKSLQERDVSGAARVVGVDVARYGDDRSVICRREGLWCHPLQVVDKLDNMTFAGIIAREIDSFDPDAVFVDAGRGEGVIDRLRQLGYAVIEVNFGGQALQHTRYANKRSEMWDMMREWIEAGGAIPNDPGLKGELAAPTYSFNARGELLLEPKEKLKERGLRSPDLADALALTFAAPIAPRLSLIEKLKDEQPYTPWTWGKDRHEMFTWGKRG
jgi:hypothetical protein